MASDHRLPFPIPAIPEYYPPPFPPASDRRRAFDSQRRGKSDARWKTKVRRPKEPLIDLRSGKARSESAPLIVTSIDSRERLKRLYRPFSLSLLSLSLSLSLSLPANKFVA